MMEDNMRRRVQFVLLLILTAALAFTACDGGGSEGGGTVDSVITHAGIAGITPPAYGEPPVTAITGIDQYTGTVSWDPADDPFKAETVYTATITLTARAGYTLSGVAEDFFTVAGATLISNDADSGVVTAEFPATGEASPAVINISAISGITLPSYAETPVTTITETDQYTGTVSWDPTDDPFKAETVYTATITLTARAGYTLSGVAEDFFTVTGATLISNDADSGVVTAEFPATGEAPPAVINISAISGITLPVRGETPVTPIIETDQYTGTVSWSPDDAAFVGGIIYTATITLTAKSGYTLTGITSDFFTVAETTSVTNAADSGVITAVFPSTDAIDIVFQSATQTGGVSGTADSTELILVFDADPETLTADNITLTGATKGALSGSGTTRSLAISNITVANGAAVTVTITNPAGYSISGTTQTAEVYRLLTIGMDYLGGKLAYILQSGDTGYDAGVYHGLIAATTDQGRKAWTPGGSTQTTSVPNGTGIDIGTGFANTENIIAQVVAAGNNDLTSYAAGIARAYNGGGYNDWYLPSMDELNILYQKRDEIGGFADNDFYWSSSENNNSNAYYLHFNNTNNPQRYGGKYSTNLVRAVRAF